MRRGSSVGQSARLIIVRSRVQAPPPLLIREIAEPPDLAERSEDTVASKSADVRPKITLACEVCKERNYITKKNRRNTPDRLSIKKYCSRCNKSTLHRETR